jgi:RNA polymerase sigma factor (sigma-70 family)
MTVEPAARAIEWSPTRLDHEVAAGSLLDRCRTGDDAAWGELVRRYERLIYSLAVRQGLRGDDASDVTQTVFEALFRSLPKLRDDHKVTSWLVAVTQRQAWRIRQSASRETPTASLSAGEGGAGGEPAAPVTAAAGAEDATTLLDQGIWLVDAINSLQEPCRSLLISLYFDPSEPSYAEVAVRLRRPLGSIGPTRARCLESLRRLLSQGDES